MAVLEKGLLAGGNMARNTTVIRSDCRWDESAGVYEHALQLWEGLEEELAYPVLFSQRGVLLSVVGCQRKTTVQRPLTSTRLSLCHRTARASTWASTSRPSATSSSGACEWLTRTTSCSMMGPSSRSGVT